METTKQTSPIGSLRSWNMAPHSHGGEYVVYRNYRIIHDFLEIAFRQRDRTIAYAKFGAAREFKAEGFIFDNYFHAWAYYQHLVQQEKSK